MGGRLAIASCAALLVGSSAGELQAGDQRASERAKREATREAAVMGALTSHFRSQAGRDSALATAAPLIGARAWVIREEKWPAPPRIRVCWESSSGGFLQERAWAVEALQHAWEAHSAVDFVDWVNCPSGRYEGVRVTVTTGQPQTIGFGKQLLGTRNGVALNFAFTSWNAQICRANEAARKSCVKATAVHEFGHALGFVHEHNRPETWHKSCTQVPPDHGVGTDTLSTVWDERSVMNYCNRNRLLQSGQLSPVDRQAVQLFYGNES